MSNPFQQPIFRLDAQAVTGAIDWAKPPATIPDPNGRGLTANDLALRLIDTSLVDSRIITLHDQHIRWVSDVPCSQYGYGIYLRFGHSFPRLQGLNDYVPVVYRVHLSATCRIAVSPPYADTILSPQFQPMLYCVLQRDPRKTINRQDWMIGKRYAILASADADLVIENTHLDVPGVVGTSNDITLFDMHLNHDSYVAFDAADQINRSGEAAFGLALSMPFSLSTVQVGVVNTRATIGYTAHYTEDRYYNPEVC